MITRVRIEARDETREAVTGELLAKVASTMEQEGGDWVLTVPPNLMTVKSGWWGYIVMEQKVKA